MPSDAKWQTFDRTGTCCDKRLMKALSTGSLNMKNIWTCEKCGCEWFPNLIEGVRVWEPHPIIEVSRGRAR